MINMKVVIGAGFGDEGKGLMTDFFASQYPDALNVRFNGGAQAGHTVVLGDVRHVFSHFGSATFRGCPTYLSLDFILNPFVFRQEYEELNKIVENFNPKVLVNADCRTSTIYDMLYNQHLENKRGADRHGSCGIGINETVNREEHVHFKLSYSRHQVIENLELVRHYYEQKDSSFIVDEKMIERFIDDCMFMNENIEFVSTTPLFVRSDFIFEGAQGLMLDEINGEFPHVTRSRTGVTNIVNSEILDIVDKNEINTEIVYATRCYATRHGNGPFWDDADEVNRYFDIVDPTNKPNDWQGTLRLGLLNVDELKKFIDLDRKQLPGTNLENARVSLAITCLKQLKSHRLIPFIWNNKIMFYDGLENFTKFLKNLFGFDTIYQVYDHGDIAVRYEGY